MKKTILLTIIILVSISFSNCSKEDELVVNNTNTIISDPANLKSSNATGMRFLDYEYGWTYVNGEYVWGIVWMRCWLWWGNCLPEVVITPDRTALYSVFLNAYNNNSIRDYFTSNSYINLFPELNVMPEVVAGLKDGTIKLYHYYNPTDQLDFYIGIPYNLNFEDQESWKGKNQVAFVIKNN